MNTQVARNSIHGTPVETLSHETIAHVDAMASAYVGDLWEPRTPESREKHAELKQVSLDLNLLDQPTLGPNTAALPGRDEAMFLVLTDLALKASSLMRSAPREELRGIEDIDDGLALDPVRFDLPWEDRSAEFARMNAERNASIAFHGSPAPSLHDRGPLNNETADRVSAVARDVVKNGTWAVAEDKTLYQAQMHVDRLERLERNRLVVGDPAVRKAYDLLHNDHALKVAEIVARALRSGRLINDMSARDARLMKDPHGYDGTGGLAKQAAGLTVDRSTTAKGRDERFVSLTTRKGVER